MGPLCLLTQTRHRRCFLQCFLTGCLALLSLATTFSVAHAQNIATPDRLTAGVFLSEPFVTRDGGSYSGLAIDLWNMVAGNIGVQTDFEEFDAPDELINALLRGDIDVAVAPLSITERRAQLIEYTHPWFDSGMRIMVRDSNPGSFSALVDGLADVGHLRVYGWLTALVFFATIVLTLIDRRFDPAFSRSWRVGLSHSFWHVMSIATSGRTIHSNLFGWVGTVIGALWMLFGIAVIAFITSSVTSVMTANQFMSRITSVADLPGKTVGVRRGSTAQDYLSSLAIGTVPYGNEQDAIQALLQGELDAFVGDRPVLEYHAHSHPREPLSVVGMLFHPEKLGFALAPDSALTRPINIEIIAADESGRLEELRRRYFGFEP